MAKLGRHAPRPGREHSGRDRYVVKNMPPIWRRSLTESGMERKTTIVDHVVVALFVLICVGVVVFLVLSFTGG